MDKQDNPAYMNGEILHTVKYELYDPTLGPISSLMMSMEAGQVTLNGVKMDVVFNIMNPFMFEIRHPDGRTVAYSTISIVEVLTRRLLGPRPAEEPNSPSGELKQTPCEHEWVEEGGEPPFDHCPHCGERRY